MSDTKKTIPNVECLKYHGNKDKPDIKIFVSNRIDQDSITIDDSIYIPVRCGAIYDKRENIEMLGDDTGDNISEKRMYLNELTVQYWAWKNIDADYYGLCHYRRYLNLSNCQSYSENQFQLVQEPYITKEIIDKYRLEEKSALHWIKKHDIVTTRLFDISKIENDPNYNHFKRYERTVGKTLASSSIKKTLEIIKTLYPDYYDTAKAHFSSSTAYFCNCFIMKKNLFHDYSKWLFNILFELEKNIDYTLLSENQSRIVGFISEDLLSIYLKYINNKIKSAYLQLVYFNNTSDHKKIVPAFNKNNIPIILAADDLYIKYASVLINSIIKNSSLENYYDILILETDISNYNKFLVSSLINNYKNFSIRFINISREIDKRNFQLYAHYKKYNVYRLIAPEILDCYDKAIYLDSDMIVNRDIKDLFSIDINNYFLGAIPDIRYHAWNNEENNDLVSYSQDVLKFNKKDLYFNSGVLLYNLSKFRNEYSASYLLSLCEARFWHYIDQDVLNIVTKDNVKFLPFNWNLMITCDKFATEQKAPLQMYNEYKEAHDNPYIIHYAGNFMPCNVPDADLFHYFWIYARDTPFYEILLNFMPNNKDLGITNIRFNNVEEFARAVERRLSSTEYKVRRFERLLGFPILRRIRKLIKK